jgi:hypothetical protein
MGFNSGLKGLNAFFFFPMFAVYASLKYWPNTDAV